MLEAEGHTPVPEDSMIGRVPSVGAVAHRLLIVATLALIGGATACATALVPAAKASISNTPMGPFHVTVFAPAMMLR